MQKKNHQNRLLEKSNIKDLQKLTRTKGSSNDLTLTLWKPNQETSRFEKTSVTSAGISIKDLYVYKAGSYFP